MYMKSFWEEENPKMISGVFFCFFFFFIYYLFIYFFATPHGIQDLRSQTRD